MKAARVLPPALLFLALAASPVFVSAAPGSDPGRRAALGETPPVPVAGASANSPARVPGDDDMAVAREYFLLARDAERRGDASSALEWYGRAFRYDSGSRDLCFLYLERLATSPASAMAAPERADTVASLTRACARLAGDRAGEPVAAGVTFAESRLLGAAAAGTGDTASAFRYFRAALDRAGPADETGDILLALAGLYEEAGDWAAHARVLERLLPRLGYPARLVERMARVYARLDRPDDFLPVLRAAWEETGNPPYAVALAALYEARGLPLSLLEVARELAARHPEPEYRELLARAFAAANRPDSALEVTADLLETIERSGATRRPDEGARESVESLRFLHATLLFERGRYKEALRQAQMLAKTRPAAPAALFLKGSAGLELGRRRAPADLDEALRLAPASPDYRARRAYAEYVTAHARGRAPDSARVEAILKTPFLADPSLPDGIAAVRVLLLDGLAQSRLANELAPRTPGERPAVFSDSSAARHRRRRALASFESVLAGYPDHVGALFEAGALRERLGDHEGAKALLRRLVAVDTAHALAMNYLAYTIVEQDSFAPGELEEAGRLLERALELEPENGAYRDSRGWWYYRRGREGDLDSARVWLEASDAAMPGDPAVIGHLVLVLHELGARAEACAAWTRLRRLDPSTGIFLHCLDAAPGTPADGKRRRP